MPDPNIGVLDEERRSNWVRLRTLIMLRWIAIAGQILAITVAQRVFQLQLELGLCYMAIGASVIANLIAIFIYPENKRLSEGEVALMLMFDISQLSFLLFLTGGLHNPFALLILAPVTISATALKLRSTVVLGAVALAMITFVGRYHYPLQAATGEILMMPQIFVFGFWVSISIGLIFLASYARRVTTEIHSMSEALLAAQMALAREQKLTDLGGVVAAAAHELGTPLATIKLTSAELMEDLSDRPELRQDAELIRDQADRCRDILRSMGRAGKDDLHLRHAPLSAVIKEAADPHAHRGKRILFEIEPSQDGDAKQPTVQRRPEIIHGLRNLVQNAVDFAGSTVWVSATWTASTINIRIVDDGPGFPLQVLSRIGDPFVRRRRWTEFAVERPEYEGMGLGLFIAKTLLERSGAELTFANGRDATQPRRITGEPRGAIVEVTWPISSISIAAADTVRPLGSNRPIEA